MSILGVKKERILNVLKRYKEKNDEGERVKNKNKNKQVAIKRFMMY